ncbi:MAG: DUF3135 domain-containing protein [Granulosicoccus sp.]|nr:DUF3135 domain-containing protein [Granulosicoccus sp.]
MQHPSSDEFDFDDWAGLYAENPAEFEARRQAALMIEMARGSAEQSEAARSMLAAYEEAAEGLEPQARMQLAASMMLDSAQQLSTELQLLKHALEPHLKES